MVSQNRSEPRTIYPVSTYQHLTATSPIGVFYPELQADDDSSTIDSEILVQTAQASRLRRRGAIRIEPNNNRPTAIEGGGVGGSPTSPEMEVDPVFHRLQLPFTMTHSIRIRDLSVEAGTRALYCGGISLNPRPISSTPHPYPLPSGPPKLDPREVYQGLSTGCGERLHDQAVPNENLGVWLASGETSSEYVGIVGRPYEELEHDLGPRGCLKVGSSRCGCVQEPMVCLSCGNSLGIRLNHCHKHWWSWGSHITQQTDETPNMPKTICIFNSTTTSHSSFRPVPFPYEIPECAPTVPASPEPMVRERRETFFPNLWRQRIPHPGFVSHSNLLYPTFPPFSSTGEAGTSQASSSASSTSTEMLPLSTSPPPPPQDQFQCPTEDGEEEDGDNDDDEVQEQSQEPQQQQQQQQTQTQAEGSLNSIGERLELDYDGCLDILEGRVEPTHERLSALRDLLVDFLHNEQR